MTAAPLERCAACGFDAAEWNELDTVNTVRNLAVLPGIWLDAVDDELANRRPSADRWSINECVDHLREVAFGMRLVVETALAEPGRDLGAEIEPGPAGDHRHLELAEVLAGLAGLAGEASALHGTLLTLEPTDWNASVTIGGTEHTIGWAARHITHDLFHHLRDIAAIRHELDPPPVTTGTVDHLAVSDGGVPKRSVEATEVGRRGLVGDRQAARQHHGRPWQAVCLWSREVIDELVELGHPIHPGAAGENLTLSGLDWAALRGGDVLRIGGMTCQLSAQAIPCAKNNQWFADDNAQQIHHERNPQWTRWYASVVEPGAVAIGDAVTLVPAIAPH